MKFPLGSSTDVATDTMTLLEDIVRLGIEQVVICGVDSDGVFTIMHEASMSPERALLLLHKGIQRIVAEPLDMEIVDDDEDDDGDE